jgi:hypothetical protein
MLFLYGFHISFCVLLISNSHVLRLNILLCDAIATFAHWDSAAYLLLLHEAKYGR